VTGEVIPDRDALYLQCAMFAGREPDGSCLEVRPLKPTGAQEWVPVRELRAAVSVVMRLRERQEVFIGVNPRTGRKGDAEHVARAWCLLGDCDTPEAVERLPRFKPRPSIVVESSPGRMHAYWPLSSAIEPEWARRGNLRIAHALGADTACADPARVMRAIGSVHRKGEPVPVRAVRCVLDTFELAEVVGGLSDPDNGVKRTRRPSPAVRPGCDSSNGPLAGLARTVREARPPTGGLPGERNALLNWAAYHAGEHVLAGHFGAEEARRELHAAALDAGLDEHETLRTLDSGLSAGIR
jgi:RepB DNA-primase from phage plasmid